MAEVTVMGGVQTTGGLKESLAVFSKHAHDTADALLNISGVDTVSGGAVHKDEPRPAYRHQEYPKMVYRETEDTVVFSPEEEENALAPLKIVGGKKTGGYRLKPYPVIQIAVLDPKQAAKNLQDTNNQLQAQIVRMQEAQEKMASQMAELLDSRLAEPEVKGRK